MRRDGPASVEDFSQLNHEQVPFRVREPPIEDDRPLHADGQTEQRSRCPLPADIQSMGGLGHSLRGNADLATDDLEVGEREAFIAGTLRSRRRRPFGG